MGFFNKKDDKTAEDYLKDAEKHALGVTTGEKNASGAWGVVISSIYASIGYISYRVGSFVDAFMNFTSASRDAYFPWSQAFAKGGSFKDNFKGLYEQFRDKFWKKTGTTEATIFSNSKEIGNFTNEGANYSSIEADVEELTELGKAYKNAGKAYKKMTGMFSKEGISSLFKENPKVASTIIGISALLGVFKIASSVNKKQEKHDQEVADNFKEAIRLDNSKLIKEIKEVSSKDKPLTIVQARSIARDRSSISQGLTPESRAKNNHHIIGEYTKSVKNIEEDENLTSLTI